MKAAMQIPRSSRSGPVADRPRFPIAPRAVRKREGSLSAQLRSRLGKLVQEVETFDPPLAAKLRHALHTRSSNLARITRAIRTARIALGQRHVARVDRSDEEILEHFRAFVALLDRDYPEPLPPRTALHRRMQMPDV